MKIEKLGVIPCVVCPFIREKNIIGTKNNSEVNYLAMDFINTHKVINVHNKKYSNNLNNIKDI